MRTVLADLIREAIAHAQRLGQIPDVVLPEVTIERPGKAEQGDFATNFALRAQRAVGPRGPRPMDIAAAISAQIAQEMPPYLAGVEAAPPGFLNFTLADDWLRTQVHAILADGPTFGQVDVGNRRRVQVEFVSANPTGPVHVGTARNAALGDSIARVLAHANWDVQREYYYNDAGAQMEHLARSVWKRYQQARGRAVELSGDDYHGEYIVELAQNILREHGDRFVDTPEADAEEMGAIAAKHIMQWIEGDLARARVTFDNWFSEARVIREGDFDRVLELLRSRDLTYQREGAEWLKSSEMGDERDRVLIKSDGRPTYTATDIAYHYDKFFVRRFDRVVNVWGADHQGQVPSLKAILKALGADPDQLDVVLYQMVKVLRHGQVVEMSKRSGTFITLADLLDEVGVDATRWFLVTRSADTAMEFDLDLAAKQSSENPVFYVQYAHARLARVLSDEGADVDLAAADLSLLVAPEELTLIRRMLQLPEVVEMAARALAPHHVPHYAYELARATQTWYDSGNDDRSLRILAEDPAVRAARLALAAAARQVLANALDLIGVSAPTSM